MPFKRKKISDLPPNLNLSPSETAAAVLRQPEIDFAEALLLGKDIKEAAAMANVDYNLARNWAKSAYIIQYLAERRKEIYAATEVTRERIATELRMMAFLDPSGLVDKNGKPLSLHEMPEEIRRCIKKVKVTEIFSGSGENRQVVGVTYEYEWYDKRAVMETINKMYGFNAPEKHLVAGAVVSLPQDLSVEELRAIAQSGTANQMQEKVKRRPGRPKKTDWNSLEEAEFEEVRTDNENT